MAENSHSSAETASENAPIENTESDSWNSRNGNIRDRTQRIQRSYLSHVKGTMCSEMQRWWH